MTVPINPIKVWLREKFLYNGDESKQELLKSTIIGVSAYVGSPLTFHILIENKFLYSDIPIIAFFHNKEPQEIFDLEDLSSILCPRYQIQNFTLETLLHKNASVRIPRKEAYYDAVYITSFDFYTGNELVHLMKLSEIGVFALVPNHKINWGGENNLPGYKKNRQDFRF